MPPKKLKSRYEGTCRKCNQKYHVGDLVIWRGKDGTDHEKCPVKAEETVTKQVLQKNLGPENKFFKNETWDP